MDRTRRCFLGIAAAGALGTAACGPSRQEQQKKRAARRPARILVRAGWSADNIGDLASASGLLRLVELNVPRAEIAFWPAALDGPARERIARHHPAVKIVEGDEAAIANADLLLHGSGEGVRAAADIEAWRRRGPKPYGFLGITVERDEVDRFRPLFDGASFVFGRERASVKNLAQAGLPQGKIGYAPDAIFSMKLADDAAAKSLLAELRLEPKKFVVVVPASKESPFRDAIASWVRETGNKVLLAPEAAAGMRPLDALRASLPAAVQSRVVRLKKSWAPDEASSVYRRAVAVLSEAYYSPLIATVNDTPAIYFPLQNSGIKGRIWDDIGLKRWYFEGGGADGSAIWQALKSIHEHYAGVQVDVHEAVIGARRLQSNAIDRIRAVLDQTI